MRVLRTRHLILRAATPSRLECCFDAGGYAIRRLRAPRPTAAFCVYALAFTSLSVIRLSVYADADC